MSFSNFKAHQRAEIRGTSFDVESLTDVFDVNAIKNICLHLLWCVL